MNDQDIINFLKAIDPGAPMALRDFDRDPRLTDKYPSAQSIWHFERDLDRSIACDVFPHK